MRNSTLPANASGRGEIFALQPEKAQQDGNCVHGQHISGQDPDHRHFRKKAADQQVRAEKSVICELEPIAASAETDPGRKEGSLLQTGASDRLRQSDMLAEPVRMRAEDSSLRNGEQNQQEKQETESRKIRRPSFY